jgi:hypothetical protein
MLNEEAAVLQNKSSDLVNPVSTAFDIGLPPRKLSIFGWIDLAFVRTGKRNVSKWANVGVFNTV